MNEKKCILIVDDDEDLAEELKGRLQYAGYESLVSLSGTEATKVLKEKKVDLILLDLMMPQGSGITVLSILQSDDKTAHIPVVVLTALEDEELKKDLKKSGVKEIIYKPFDEKELLRVISFYLKHEIIV